MLDMNPILKLAAPLRKIRMGTRTCVTVIGILLAVVSSVRAVELNEAELANRRCYACHNQSHMSDLTPQQRRSMVSTVEGDQTAKESATRPGLYVTPTTLQDSPHAKLACVSCHTQAQQLPHAQNLGPVQCATSCHGKEGAAYRRSSHAQALANGNPQAPTCANCHGGHQILPASNRNSMVYPLNVIKTCGNCHEQHSDAMPAEANSQQKVTDYLGSVHGKAVKAGLVVAATCADCHRAHDVQPAANPDSSVNRIHVPDTCGRCHVGIDETYQKSIHGQLLAKGNPDAPICVDCHTAHKISAADTPKFMRDITNGCGKCHDKPLKGDPNGVSLYKTYRSSYHGQVSSLGSNLSAKCSDCHGSHDILPASDPASHVAPANLVDTCSKCHEGVTEKFTQYRPHADFRSANTFPLLHYVWIYFIIVMSFTFSFFGLHTILWFIRARYEQRKNGKPKHHSKNEYGIRRFTRVDRINHGVMIVSFFGLTLTGMPLLFSDHSWAGTLTFMLGGVRSAGIIHRICAVMLMGNFAVHFWGVIQRFRRRSGSILRFFYGPDSLVPRPKDLFDCLGMFRWFITGKNAPRFDHWAYWEKFDYWAEIFGTGVIGTTGLMLWFPAFFANYLPGWLFNIATLVHGYEALLAVVFIFTIHFFNAHLRPEKFPVDDVMFTGQLSEEEFKHERAEEYDRLVKEGKLEAMRVKLPPRWYRYFAVFMGILAMLIGTIMTVLIILAGLGVI
jgi:cytochrome b subunit of formate dehydrogenase